MSHLPERAPPVGDAPLAARVLHTLELPRPRGDRGAFLYGGQFMMARVATAHRLRSDYHWPPWPPPSVCLGVSGRASTFPSRLPGSLWIAVDPLTSLSVSLRVSRFQGVSLGVSAFHLDLNARDAA